MTLPSPLESLNGVWLFQRPPRFHSVCDSLPGHLVHLLAEGSYELSIGGMERTVEPGDLIYYYESERVECKGLSSPVAFYSVSFFSKSFAPLPLDGRVLKAGAGLKKLFPRLHDAYYSKSSFSRDCLCHALLLRILAGISELRPPSPSLAGDGPGLWSSLEDELRRRRLFRASLDEMAELSGRSKSSVVRACRAERSMSPQGSLRALRMAEAQGLLKFASLSVGQVAEYLGYPRMHEFSREFSSFFGKPPSEARWSKR